MRIATLSDAGDVLEMDFGPLNTDTDKVALLKVPGNVCYINDASTAMFAYNCMVAGVWQCHILSKEEARGKGMQEFAYCTAVRMVKDCGMKSLITFVPRTNRANRLFVSYFGMKKRITTEDFAVYHVEREQILNFKTER